MITVKILIKYAEAVTVMVINTEVIDKTAVTFADNIYYWNNNDFKEWVLRLIDIIKRVRKTFPGAGDLRWSSRDG